MGQSLRLRYVRPELVDLHGLKTGSMKIKANFTFFLIDWVVSLYLTLSNRLLSGYFQTNGVSMSSYALVTNVPYH